MDGQSGTRSALGELQLNAGADDGISDENGAGAFAPPSAAQLMERSAATQEGVAALLSFGGAEAGAAGSNEPWPSDRMLRELEQLAARPLPPPVRAMIELYGDLVWQLPLQNRPIKAQLRGTVRAVESERFKLETFVSLQQQYEGSAAVEYVWVPITAEWVPTFQHWKSDGMHRLNNTTQRMPETTTERDRLACLPHTAADFERVCVARHLPGKGNQLWFVFYAVRTHSHTR